jgi:hypothetical protein
MLVHPEVVEIPGVLRERHDLNELRSKKGTNCNALITAEDKMGLDPLSGMIELSPKVRIKRLKQEKG